MIRKFLLTFIFLQGVNYCLAQNESLKNVTYIEGLGNGFFGSINYEKQLTKQPGLAVRIGVGYYTSPPLRLTLPMGINYLVKFKNEKSFLDLGLGITVIPRSRTIEGKRSYILPIVPSIGYRRHTTNNFMWRISVTPLTGGKRTLVPWAGISIGKRF